MGICYSNQLPGQKPAVIKGIAMSRQGPRQEIDVNPGCGSDEDAGYSQQMLVTSQEDLTAGRIDEWSTLPAEEEQNLGLSLSARLSQACMMQKDGPSKIAKPGSRHFIADMPESNEIMVFDNGRPLWLVDVPDNKDVIVP
mmetsp:Transcript_87586/g.165090  ORF Transcript_87586/g.165090 Transcript_87586/m.165090 type:complete len:140 (+) Transcript_87586:70-489(+)